jgi:hypothetical protein
MYDRNVFVTQATGWKGFAGTKGLAYLCLVIGDKEKKGLITWTPDFRIFVTHFD